MDAGLTPSYGSTRILLGEQPGAPPLNAHTLTFGLHFLVGCAGQVVKGLPADRGVTGEQPPQHRGVMGHTGNASDGQRSVSTSWITCCALAARDGLVWA